MAKLIDNKYEAEAVMIRTTKEDAQKIVKLLVKNDWWFQCRIDYEAKGVDYRTHLVTFAYGVEKNISDKLPGVLFTVV